MKEFKSFTARKIIDYLKGRNAIPLLEKLGQAKLHHKKESDYQLEEMDSDIETEFLEYTVLSFSNIPFPNGETVSKLHDCHCEVFFAEAILLFYSNFGDRHVALLFAMTF